MGSRKRDDTSSCDTSSADSSETDGADEKTKLKKQLSKLIKQHFKSNVNSIDYKEEHIQVVLDKCKEIFASQSMLVGMRAPVNVCGDVHGQFHDLKRLFNNFGRPPQTTYLFLGDYVDRGKYSLEVIMLLFAMKARWPHTLVLLRGNHECSNVNKVYGFYDELQRRNLAQFYPQFNKVFDYMPIAAVINNKILCMHGGISKHINSLQDIDNIERPLSMVSKQRNPLALDLLWADPDKNGRGYSKSKRGVSSQFGMDVLTEFCIKHNLDLIVRAHQVVARGFERLEDHKGCTRVVTIFSAPNYCGEMDNAAACMIISQQLGIKFKVMQPDTENAAERNAVRAQVPLFDMYPLLESVKELENNINFDPLARRAEQAYDTASQSIASARDSMRDSVASSRLFQQTKGALSNVREKLKKKKKDPKDPNQKQDPK